MFEWMPLAQAAAETAAASDDGGNWITTLLGGGDGPPWILIIGGVLIGLGLLFLLKKTLGLMLNLLFVVLGAGLVAVAIYAVPLGLADKAEEVLEDVTGHDRDAAATPEPAAPEAVDAPTRTPPPVEATATPEATPEPVTPPRDPVEVEIERQIERKVAGYAEQGVDLPDNLDSLIALYESGVMDRIGKERLLQAFRLVDENIALTGSP